MRLTRIVRILMKKYLILSLALLTLNGCTIFYQAAKIEKSSDASLSCQQLIEEFEFFKIKENKIAADARALTGNRYTEYLILPLYFLNPMLWTRASGGADHNIPKVEHSYICRQANLLRLMKKKDCKVIESQKYEYDWRSRRCQS